MPLPLIPLIIAAVAVASGCKGEESKPSAGRKEFVDGLDSLDRDRWEKSHGWSNGDPFGCGWRAENTAFSKEGDNGILSLVLEEKGASEKPFSSGEYRTTDFYGYGTLEARFKAVKAEGTVTSLFFYTGKIFGDPWDEIDVEILGKDPTKLQTNYIAGGMGGHERLIDLGFDASQDFHTYTIKWEHDRIVWFVDGKQVHTEDGSRGLLPKTPGRIYVNLWPAKGEEDRWGLFKYTGKLVAQYDWIKFTPSQEKVPEAPVKARTEGETPLSEAIAGAFPFNGAQAAVLENGIKFSAKGVNDPGLTMPFKKSVSGKLCFEHKGTVKNEWGGDFFSVLFLGAGEKLLLRKDVTPGADAQKIELDIPEGTVKVNLMSVGKSSADIQLTNVVIKDKKD